MIHDDGQGCSLRELDELLSTHAFHGFPVVCGEQLLGFVTRDKLRQCIEPLVAEDAASGNERRCTFLPPRNGGAADMLNLSSIFEEAVLQLRKDVPLELVVNMFHKLNLRHVLFSQGGKLTGLVTKADITWLLTAHFSHTGALSEKHR
ncbi:hypothetical protein A0H81_07821 [Grifola frondosa]|uniref:CBS domain-containing protein n=1 Tax=Grifola frondosa TaxID=5627 RepID=A0A1C7M7Q3_GRIFR|nr:hypothetical protein A0H81_07821 [Grifola frondosa]